MILKAFSLKLKLKHRKIGLSFFDIKFESLLSLKLVRAFLNKQKKNVFDLFFYFCVYNITRQKLHLKYRIFIISTNLLSYEKYVINETCTNLSFETFKQAFF